MSAAEVSEIVDFVVNRYLSNLRIARGVASEYNTTPLFLWQPHPGYKYDATLHKSFPFEHGVPQYFHRIYEAMENYRAPDFVFLGGLMEESAEKAYVDDVHYNERVNEQIAQAIAERIVSAELGAGTGIDNRHGTGTNSLKQRK
jgi:hypothetical protein